MTGEPSSSARDELPWVVIRFTHADPDYPAVDVYGPFGTADEAVAWADSQPGGDFTYRPEPVATI